MKRTNRKNYQKQLEVCHEAIDYLQKTLDTMEEQLEELERIESQNDHRFIHELYHLCRKHPSYSLKLTQSPSHDDMKTYVQQTFNHLFKRSSSKMNPNHYPNYQTCLDILEEYQKLFDVKCFKQIPISLTDFYHKHGELNNFIRSISNIVGVESQNEKLVIKTLEKIVEDSNFDQMNQFKKLARVKSMDEAIRKMHSYDNFVPYYHQFIGQVVNILEVSKPDQIIPAIKMLKLLANNKRKYQ